jgi:hypothetical protein
VGGILPEFAGDVAAARQVRGAQAKAAENQMVARLSSGRHRSSTRQMPDARFARVLLTAEPDAELSFN